MPEQNNSSDSADTQDGDESQSQADTTTTQAGSRQQQQSGQQENQSDSRQSDQGGDTMSRDEAKKLRTEAQQLRRRNKELEQANMTEQERLAANLKELETDRGTFESRALTAERQATEYRAQIALFKAGATHPELIASRMTADDLVDEKATKAAVDKLKKDYPDLFGIEVRGSADGANGGAPVRRTGSMNDQLRAGWRRG